VVARSNTVPSTGPIHGVQPTPNAAPNANALTEFPRQSMRGIFNCHDRSKKDGRITPSIKRPKTITSAPPMRSSHKRHGTSALPKNPARTPNVIKTTLKPATNESPVNITLRFASRFAPFFSSSSGIPLKNAKYPGTNGSVHGARNVSKPAINAGIMSENSTVIY